MKKKFHVVRVGGAARGYGILQNTGSPDTPVFSLLCSGASFADAMEMVGLMNLAVWRSIRENPRKLSHD